MTHIFYDKTTGQHMEQDDDTGLYHCTLPPHPGHTWQGHGVGRSMHSALIAATLDRAKANLPTIWPDHESPTFHPELLRDEVRAS